MTQLSTYADIDPMLSSWAVQHSLRWLTDYQDTEVRTFYINGSEHRVQVAVDQPTEDSVVVRIGRSGPGKNRSFSAELKCRRDELGKTLDVALETARLWSR
jgi:hypothetical protein